MSEAAGVEVESVQLDVGPAFRLSIENWSVAANERVAVIGRNGSGKSVLLELLAGVRKHHSGSVRLLGVDAAEYARNPKLRRDIGAQFQSGYFDGSLYVRELISAYKGIYDIDLPVHELGKPVREFAHQRYGELSYGRRKALHLLLASGHQPNLLLLDEPTSGLDHDLRRMGDELLQARDRGRNVSVIFASHEVREIDHADKVCWLADGTIRDWGAPNELLRRYLGTYRGELGSEGRSSVQELSNRCREAGVSLRICNTEADTPVVFAEVDFGPIFSRLAYERGLSEYEYRRTSLADLLDLVSGSYDNDDE